LAEDREIAVSETLALLAEVRTLGFKAPITKIAEIIGVNPSTVSAYGKPRKGGTKAHPMPLHHRIALRAALAPPAGPTKPHLELVYPSQRVTYAHELIEALGVATNADDSIWTMAIRILEVALEEARKRQEAKGS
jgi:hypothetical protein